MTPWPCACASASAIGRASARARSHGSGPPCSSARERAARAVLLHEVGPLGGVVELEHLDDVRVRRRPIAAASRRNRSRPSLGLRDPRVQQLDRDDAVQSLVDGAPHLAGSTRADAVLEPVAAVDLHGRNVAYGAGGGRKSSGRIASLLQRRDEVLGLLLEVDPVDLLEVLLELGAGLP